MKRMNAATRRPGRRDPGLGSGRMVMRRAGAWLGLLCALALSAQASASGKFAWEDYDKRITASQAVSPLGPDLLGDQVSLSNGGLSFSATDVSLPGNNNLAIAFSRSYSVYNRKDVGSGGDMLADWSLDAPSISGSFAPDWISAGTPGNRCSDTLPPPVPYGAETVAEFWRGLEISIPGVASGELLVAEAGITKPADGNVYRWVTNDQIHVSCLATIKNGTGQGFLAITPDGTRYWFDWMAGYPEPHLKSVRVTPERTYTSFIPRRKNVLYATRVEDRFGNAVTYTYTNAWNQPGKLTAINSSDGRQLTVGYGGNGYIASVSDGTRTWQYTYGSTGAGRTTLVQVIQPDSSRWSISFAGFTDAEIQTLDGYPPGEIMRTCTMLEMPQNYADEPTGSITHPSGATGTFITHIKEHGRSNVVVNCGNVTTKSADVPLGTGNDPNDDLNFYTISYNAFTLKQKRLTGPGLVPAEWNYAYVSGRSVHRYPGTTFQYPVCTVGAQCYQPPCTSDSCAGSSKTTITGPGNEWVRYTYGNSWLYNEGKLLKVERGSSEASILNTVDHSYDLSRTNQVYPARYGSSTKYDTEGFVGEYHRPRQQTIISQDGATFSRTVNTFDPFARPLAETAASSLGHTRAEVTAYHDNHARWVLGQVAKRTIAGIVASETGYDTLARPTWYKAFGKLTQTLGYNTDGTLATYKDGRNSVTTLSNWYRGVPRSIAWPDGTGVSATVNANGTLASTTDENGYKTCYAYDAMGRLASITYPSESQLGVCNTSAWSATTQAFAQVGASEYGIPAGHWRQTVQTGDGVRINYFDAMWRPLVVREYDAGNASATQRFNRFAYDHAGRTTFASYPSTSSSPTTGTRTVYDALGRTKTVTQDSELGPLTTTTAYLNNSNGYYTRVTNPREQLTYTWFQAFDQPSYDTPVTIWHPAGAYTDIARDVFGKPLTLTRRNSTGSAALTRRYYYDGNQQLCRTAEPETGSTVLAYDAAGNLAWSAAGMNYPLATACYHTQANASGRRVDRTYDARNRQTELRFPNGLGDTVTSYTPDGQPAAITAYNGSAVVTTSYEYNRRRLPTRERMQWGSIDWSVYHAYNANGHPSQRTIQGLALAYAPNALGQPTQVGAYATGVSYFPNGAPKAFTYGNGIVHTLTQNARGLPERSRDAYGSTAFLDDSYDYDPNGNVLAISDGATGTGQRGNRDMTYDGLDRLKTTVSPMYGSWNAIYAYDVLDNLTQVKVGGAAARNHYYCYDAANRLTNVKTGGCGGSTVIGLGYDVQGNVANKSGDTFNFDFGNRLRSATVGGVATSYVYDALGRRVRDFTGASKYSMYTQDGQLAFVSNLRDKSQQWHVYLGSSLIAIRERDTTTGALAYHYQHTDALGSPVAVTDANRVVIRRNEYEPYGHLLNQPMNDRPGYTGHVMDAATGLTYAQQRYYDQKLGVFLSVDPVTADGNRGGNFNRYWYANNNPYRFTDPDGRLACTGGNHLECQEKIREMEERGNFPFQAGGKKGENRRGDSDGDSELPALPARSYYFDGDGQFVSTGETWKRELKYAGQGWRSLDMGEGAWTQVPLISETKTLTSSIFLGVLLQAVTPDIAYGYQTSVGYREYEIGFRHVFTHNVNMVEKVSRDVQLGHGTIWTGRTTRVDDPSMGVQRTLKFKPVW